MNNMAPVITDAFDVLRTGPYAGSMAFAAAKADTAANWLFSAIDGGRSDIS